MARQEHGVTMSFDSKHYLHQVNLDSQVPYSTALGGLLCSPHRTLILFRDTVFLLKHQTTGNTQPIRLRESGIPIQFFPTEQQSFKLLSRKRVDLIVVDKEFANYMLSQAELQEFADTIE